MSFLKWDFNTMLLIGMLTTFDPRQDEMAQKQNC